MSDKVKIAVIGSGPSGLSCAAHAAELGLSHVLLEAEEQPSYTIYRYQKGKHVMAEPAILPLRSPISFSAGKREAILKIWNDELLKYKVNIRKRSAVTAITGSHGDFAIKTAAGETIRAEHVVLCIGVQGNLRKLGVPGEDLERVQYQLNDPAEYVDETIVVIGGGDASIENALALADNNRVILINRTDEFSRAKQRNIDAILDMIKSGRIECRYNCNSLQVVKPVDESGNDGKPLCYVAQTAKGVEQIPCDRVIARLGALPSRKLVESFGVSFPSPSMEAIPRLSATYESNVPGLYIIGALGGYPLIKQAMNQGYEVVEYILGNPVEPADEPLLKNKFKKLIGTRRVADVLAQVQANVPLFAEMTALQLREFMLDSDVLTPLPNQVISRQGDYTNSFFSILDGEVRIEMIQKDGQLVKLTLKRGQFFGELGLLSGRRRSATTLAGSNCVLIETPRRSMLKLIASVESVRQQLDQTSLRRAVSAQIAPQATDAELDEIVKGAVIESFAAGQELFKEGDEPDGLRLIRRGSVTISQSISGKEIVLAYLAAGNYVGEMALLSGARRSATVRAAVNCETILLTANAFNAVMGRNTSMRYGMQSKVLERVAKNVRQEGDPNTGGLIGFLVEQGMGEGTDVLLIDRTLCVGCDNCEKACADVHDGSSRLDRHSGPSFANIHVPTSCRHCEHPHCMKECPPDAIHRNPNGEVFIADTCIGCGNCERNCPYGVIQMAQINPDRRPPSLLMWLISGLTPEPGREDQYHNDNLGKKAVKCDMCKDLSGGPACVRACPTGAAIRVSPEQFIEYAAR